MTKSRQELVQAVVLLPGKVNVGAGTYRAQCLIHCETDASITLNWPTPETYNMLAGDDRGFEGSFTVVTGTVTYE